MPFPLYQASRPPDEQKKDDAPKKEDEAPKPAQPSAPATLPPAPVPPLPPGLPPPPLPFNHPVAPFIPNPPLLEPVYPILQVAPRSYSLPAPTDTIQPILFPFPSDGLQEKEQVQPRLRKRRDQAVTSDEELDNGLWNRERPTKDRTPAPAPYNGHLPVCPASYDLFQADFEIQPRKLKSALKSSSSTPLSSPIQSTRQFSDSDFATSAARRRSADNSADILERERLFGPPKSDATLDEIYLADPEAPLDTTLPDPFDESAWTLWQGPKKDYKAPYSQSPSPPIPSVAPVYTPVASSRLVLRNTGAEIDYPELDDDLQAFVEQFYTEKTPAISSRRDRPKPSARSSCTKLGSPQAVRSLRAHKGEENASEPEVLSAELPEELPTQQQYPYRNQGLAYVEPVPVEDEDSLSAQRAPPQSPISVPSHDLNGMPWEFRGPAPIPCRPQSEARNQAFDSGYSGFDIPDDWETSV